MVDSAAGDAQAFALATKRTASVASSSDMERVKRFIYAPGGFRVGWRLDGIGTWAWCKVVPASWGGKQRIEFVAPCTLAESEQLKLWLNARIVMRYAADAGGEPWSLASHQ